MRKLLLTHSLSAFAALSALTAEAQVETFTVPVAEVDGMKIEKRYFVNWENGISGEIENLVTGMPEFGSYLKIGNPVVMAALQSELSKQTMLMAETLKDIEAKSLLAAEQFDKLSEATDNIKHSYLTEIENLTNLYLKMLDAYESMSKDIEAKLQDTRSIPTRATQYDAGLSSIISDWDYSVFMVNFTQNYLNDLADEIVEAGESMGSEGDEAAELIEMYVKQAETAESTLYILSDYYETNQDNLSYDQLEELNEMIIENVELIAEVVKGYETEPMSYTYLLLGFCRDSLESVTENYLEAVEKVKNLYARLSQLPDLTTTLYCGLENEPFGLAYNIINNDGTLVVPSEQSYLDETFTVSEIIGYMFGPCYDRENPLCHKVVIPKSVSSIKNEAFAAPGIHTVVCEANATDEYIVYLSDDSFTPETYQDAILYVPDGSIEYYAQAPGWKNFKNIHPISQASVEGVDNDIVSINVSGSSLIVKGAEGKSVEVYRVDGLKIYEGKENIINLPSSGIYIVRIGKSIFKVAR
jgi:hypothetical protein